VRHFLFYGLALALLFTISFTLISEPVFAQMNTSMSPRHQMQMMNDPSNVECQQGMVLMMKNATGNPVCVNPSSYWRLADRSWGIFDTNLLNQNQNHMHGVMGAMINHPQMSQHMHDWMKDNPQHMQNMMDTWMPQMMQNDQWMMNMMGPMMNDPELNQQMMNHMMMNPQMMDTMKSNQQWMGMMHGQPMMSGGMYHGMMMNSTMNCPWCPFMQDSMNQSMKGMGCAWCQGHMGQGMMGSGMMNKGMMMGQQTQSSMQTGQTPSHGWMMQNPQHMQTMMNHMMNDPKSMQTMHGMMMQNPQHMHGMMNNMMGPMMNHMMNDPQMQQQMMNHMMNHPQMMQQWMQNQQYFDSQNGDVSDKTETGVNSQNAQVSIALGSASPGCEKTNECYLPYSISISEYSSVTWTNDDIAVHTVTSGIPSDGPNGIFDSGAISPGSTFTNQFDEDGTFDYYCIAHPWMTGKVVVEE
jgi:plastocyanin